MFGRKSKGWQQLNDESKVNNAHQQKTPAKPKKLDAQKKRHNTNLFPEKNTQSTQQDDRNKAHGMVPAYYGPGTRP